jgi:hypothetical protein
MAYFVSPFEKIGAEGDASEGNDFNSEGHTL